MLSVVNHKKNLHNVTKVASPKKDFETKHMGIFLAGNVCIMEKKTCFWIIVLHNP